MKKKPAMIMALLVVLGGALWFWSSDRNLPIRIEKIEFLPGGTRLVLNREAEIKRICIQGEHGTEFDQDWPDIRRRTIQIQWTWRPGKACRFMVATGRGTALKTAVPDHDLRFPASVVLSIPYNGSRTTGSGLVSQDKSESKVVAGQWVSSALMVVNHLDGPARLSGHIRFPKGLHVRLEPSADQALLIWKQHETVIGFKKTFSAPHQALYLAFSLKPEKPEASEVLARINLQSDQDEFSFAREIAVSAVTSREYAQGVHILDFHLPSTKDGRTDWRSQADTLFYKPEFFRRLAARTGWGRTIPWTPWLPYTYQVMIWKNRSTHPVHLMISSKIEHVDQKGVVPAFFPPDVFTGALKDKSVVVSASAGPGETVSTVIPVFVTSPPIPGQYRRTAVLFPAGGRDPIQTLIRPLSVVSIPYGALALAALSGLCCIVGLPLLALALRRTWSAWKVRWFVVIALFGAMIFVVVNLPLRFFGALIHAALGPFSVFVTGFFNDLIYFSLLMALLRLIPRPGVATLSILVRFFLSGLTSGFSVVEVLTTGSSIVFLETALFISGMTRKKEAFVWTWRSAASTAFHTGLAGALANATGLFLFILLYRLYFADWYLKANIFFNGFVFTFIGVLLGKRFSETLIWAEE